MATYKILDQKLEVEDGKYILHYHGAVIDLTKWYLDLAGKYALAVIIRDACQTTQLNKQQQVDYVYYLDEAVIKLAALRTRLKAKAHRDLVKSANEGVELVIDNGVVGLASREIQNLERTLVVCHEKYNKQVAKLALNIKVMSRMIGDKDLYDSYIKECLSNAEGTSYGDITTCLCSPWKSDTYVGLVHEELSSDIKYDCIKSEPMNSLCIFFLGNIISRPVADHFVKGAAAMMNIKNAHK